MSEFISYFLENVQVKDVNIRFSRISELDHRPLLGISIPGIIGEEVYPIKEDQALIMKVEHGKEMEK